VTEHGDEFLLTFNGEICNVVILTCDNFCTVVQSAD